MEDYDLSFDLKKSDNNLAERGYDYVYAAGALRDVLWWSVDDRKDYGEERVQVVGRHPSDKKLYFLVYTIRNSTYHIISSFPYTENKFKKLQLRSIVQKSTSRHSIESSNDDREEVSQGPPRPHKHRDPESSAKRRGR